MNIRNKINVAAAQFDIKLFEKEYNLKKMESMTIEAKEKYNSDIIVFPESAIGGYSFTNIEEVISVSERIDGFSVKRMSDIAVKYDIAIVFGMSELTDNTVYNSSVFCLPDAKVHIYRKTHIPLLGLDGFVSKGDSLAVFDTEFGKVGLIVCFDMRFPEAVREEALQGARLIAHSTNLPSTGKVYAEFINRTRACENRVFVVSANRIGNERGYCFIGHSQIIDCNGNVLQEIGEKEGIIAETIDLSKAEEKDVIINPGVHEMRLFSSRRPEIYYNIANLNISKQE